LLRLWGVAFGLPALYDPDEWNFVGRALRMLHDRDPNPHWFGHPGTTIMYLLSAIYAAIFVIRLAAGSIRGAADFESLYYRDPTLFYLSGRIVIVLFGTATIVAAYLVARRLGNGKTGLLAAAVLALSPTHVLYSKLIRGDIPIGFLMLVALWFCLNVLERRRSCDYLVAGFLTGLAVVTKYTATILLGPILLSHLEAIQWRVRDLRKHTGLLASGVACLAGCFVGSPFLFIEFQTALSDVAYEARSTHLSATGEGYLKNLLWYFVGPLPGALTWLGVLLAGLGILSYAGFRRRRERVVASVPILFLLVISAHGLRWERWIVPAIPMLCIPLAHSIELAARWAGKRLSKPLAPWLSAGLLALIAVPLLRTDIAQARALTRPDTRTLAGEWMLVNLPPGSRMLMEAGTPQLPRHAFVFLTVGREGLVERIDAHAEDHALFRADGSIGRLRDTSLIEEAHIRFLVMSNRYDRYLAEEERYSDVVRGYERILQEVVLIYEIPGNTVETGFNVGGPRIRIYAVE
jgi:4-amino-4-deoxy-L-arabinose transferase-like glycosyltransferase